MKDGLVKTPVLKTVWFRCIATLLSIALITFGVLAIASDLFYVSEEDRLSRAVEKVYGKSVAVEKAHITFSCKFGEFNGVYCFSDGGEDYALIYSVGYEGFKGGTVSLWVLTKAEKITAGGKTAIDIKSVENVVLGGSEKQTLMSNLTGEFYGYFSELDINLIADGEYITVTEGDYRHLVTGATRSSNAANNAYNTVLEYSRGIEK